MYELFMRYLEKRLYQWADWHIRGNFYGLGYPSCSLEYRFLTEGNTPSNRGIRSLPNNKAAEEIEELVQQMAAYNLMMANILRCQYFLTGTLRTRAASLKISHSHFKYYLDMARQWLAGRLSAENLIFERIRDPHVIGKVAK